MKKLILFDGMTGAGKSSVALNISRKIPNVAVIGMDKIKWFVSDFSRTRKNNEIARDVIFSMVNTYLDHEISVLLDQSLVDSDVVRYRDLGNQSDVELFCFQLFARPEVAKDRILQRKTQAENPLSMERIQRNIGLFSPREGFIQINTSDESIEGVSQKIIDTLNS